MASYIYLPVVGPEMIALSAQLAGVLNATVIQKPRLRLPTSPGCLSRLHATDTLYIFTHGAGRGDTATIAAKENGWLPRNRQHYDRETEHWVGGVFKAFTTEQMADDLRAEGLPLNFIDMHVLACGGGYAGALSPWVGRFCTKLSRTHVFVEVTGYQGFVHVSSGSIRVEDRNERGARSFYSLEEKAVVYRSGYAEMTAGRGRSSFARPINTRDRSHHNT
ncbi:hypothetical protein O5O45_10155 [Hahella aquimaris]|uniref:hypothetical protein n=1 Tax=Hahella sp. HNIBRBA332 TaxID=3015983 RepID=UPI00273B11F9|nr:hypothetical protein [Hahella sp. HNIBRBA332]WLQ16278.1 hypothetical protein O5O45_10155 [Hahella sp. HNIBRBA332]